MTADTRRSYDEPWVPFEATAIGRAMAEAAAGNAAAAAAALRAQAIVFGDPEWCEALMADVGAPVGWEDVRLAMDAVAGRLAADPLLRQPPTQDRILERLRRWAERVALTACELRPRFLEGRSGRGEGDVVIRLEVGWDGPPPWPDPGGAPPGRPGADEDRILEGSVK